MKRLYETSLMTTLQNLKHKRNLGLLNGLLLMKSICKKNYRCVITDVENKSVIDILRKRIKNTIISYLSKIQNIGKIGLVAMDMWDPYKSAVNTVIPSAKIVIDKFHVGKLANEALEKIRKANRQNVSAKERRQLMRDRYVLLTRRNRP